MRLLRRLAPPPAVGLLVLLSRHCLAQMHLRPELSLRCLVALLMLLNQALAASVLATLETVLALPQLVEALSSEILKPQTKQQNPQPLDSQQPVDCSELEPASQPQVVVCSETMPLLLLPPLAILCLEILLPLLPVLHLDLSLTISLED